MHVVAVANGELGLSPSRREFDQPFVARRVLQGLLDGADLVIAADGGLESCRRLDRWPDRLVGDLDSIASELLLAARDHGVEIQQYPRDKNETDLELALGMARDADAQAITVLTPFGGRLDHELATIALLASERFVDVQVDAVDGRRRLTVVRATSPIRLTPGATVSLLPWAGPATGVTTAGLRWPLTDAVLPLGTTRGVSNVVVDVEASVSITAGVLLVVSDSLESTTG